MDRYNIDPSRIKGQKGIVEFVQEAFRRIGQGESSLQVGHTSIEDGNLVVRNGDIIVSESDDSIVIQIRHGATPEIRFFPLGATDTHRVALFGFDFNDGVGGGPDQCVQFCVETTGAVQDGGKILLSRNFSILSHQPNGAEESYLWLNGNPIGFQETIFRGRWTNQNQIDTNQGIYPGVISLGAGFSSWTHSYFTSFASTMAPVVGLVNTGGALSWVISAMSTSAFTVAWTGTAAKVINFWNFRIS